jgi:GNAT superfamily N-acetyltransferase
MIVVRQAVASDAESLIEVARMWPMENGSLVAPLSDDGTVDIDRVIGTLNDPTYGVIIAIDDHKPTVVGYAAGYTSGMERKAKLEEIMVAFEYQRQGIGGRLVRAFEEWARASGVETCTLGGGPAPGFYEKLGWRRSGIATFLKRL